MKTSILLCCLSAVVVWVGAARAQPEPPARPSAPAPDEPPRPAPVVDPPTALAPAVSAPPAAQAGAAAPSPAVPDAPTAARKTTFQEANGDDWYDRIKLRGYTQLRYNRLLETNEKLVSHGDKSVGKDGGLFIRRARLVILGDVHEHLAIYLQPDFASSINDQLNVAIMRDWYADVFIDKGHQLRLRLGQSKIPFGFENLQSSQNRLPLDRADGLNSAQKDERDLGAFVYYAPTSVRKLLKRLVDSGLKGSGDYGMVGLGIYNGQGANAKEKNSQPHAIARLAFPFELFKQILEVNVGGYTGRYAVTADANALPGVQVAKDYRDARLYAGFILYPQPIGLQLEYNVGRGPQLDRDANAVRTRDLHGGYALASVKLGPVIPFVRVGNYHGGRKSDPNAPRNDIRELEAGVEWQAFKALELTAAYNVAERTSPAGKQEYGRFARIQVQFNY